MATKTGVVALLNAIAQRELGSPRAKRPRHNWHLTCGPHPHEGPHKRMCRECGASKSWAQGSPIP